MQSQAQFAQTSQSRPGFPTQAMRVSGNGFSATFQQPQTSAAKFVEPNVVAVSLPVSGTSAYWRQPNKRDHLVEQYYCTPGPDPNFMK